MMYIEERKYTNLEGIKEKHSFANAGVFENHVLLFDKFGKLLCKFTIDEFEIAYGASPMPTYRGSNE